MTAQKIEINQRVKRAKRPGCFGIVKDVRTEVTSAREKRDKGKNGLMIRVKWDNGTESYLAPEALEVVN